jgi:hypothetical protein
MVYQKKSVEDTLDSNVGVLDRPIETSKQEEVKKPIAVKEDDGLRTVLHGWGIEPSTKRWLVDNFLCEGGVIRNVPLEAAEMMQKGLRKDKDGKLVRAYGYIKIQAILPSDATEADFIRATGITPMPVNKFAAMLKGFNAQQIRDALGDSATKDLIKALSDAMPQEK